MKIIVLGAGQVGSTVAQSLALEDNDVTIVDINEHVLREIGARLDVGTVCGAASYPDVLRRAGAEDADMIIAATDSDETNIVAMQVAYSAFHTPQKIARIRSVQYTQERSLFNNDHIPINVLISPEQLVTDHIQRIIEHPGAMQVIDFADGLVRLVGVSVQEGAPMANQAMSHLTGLLGDIEARVVAIYRGEECIIADGDTLVQVDDVVFYLGYRTHTAEIMKQFHHDEYPVKNVMIAGAGNIGFRLAQKLERNYNVKVIEANPERNDYIAGELSQSLVLLGDAANHDLLVEENVHEMDVFCALTNDDEANILSAMLAKRMGARKVMSLINRPAYVDLVERDIIDVAISPQQITIGALLTHIRRGDVVAVHSLRKGRAEALEGVAHGDEETSMLVGRELGNIDLPSSAAVGAVVRGKEVLIAHHDLVIQAEDHLIVLITNKQQIHEVEKLFQVGVTFI
jgi:trk system potassium uptake protein